MWWCSQVGMDCVKWLPLLELLCSGRCNWFCVGGQKLFCPLINKVLMLLLSTFKKNMKTMWGLRNCDFDKDWFSDTTPDEIIAIQENKYLWWHNKMRDYDIKFPIIFQNSLDKVNQNWVPNVPEERIAECNKNILKKLNK